VSGLSRRRFVRGLGVAGAAVLAGCGPLPWPAQPAAPTARMHRLGYLGVGALAPPLREGLRELGYVEGQNLIIEARDPGDSLDRSAELAAELVALPVDLILTNGLGHLRAAKAATGTIPIVNAGGGGDLVQLGIVDSLARPGGNVTGTTVVADRLHGKGLQLLAEAAAPVARMAVLCDGNTMVPQVRAYFEAEVSALGIQPLIVDPRGPDALEGAFATISEHADAVYVVASPLAFTHRARVVALAAQHRLPAMYEIAPFVRAGGLMAYQGSAIEMFRRAAYYVDRILKGASPADLPIEQPRETDFVINLGAARGIGLTIPEQVLVRATEVIP
jgi:putative tryptophan/tyrosine transport system substrate-binding protein